MDVTQADNHDLQASMGRFQAALSAEAPRMAPPKIDRILLAIDGSNQDATASALAAAIALRFRASLDVIYAYAGSSENDRDQYARSHVESLLRQGAGEVKLWSGVNRTLPPYEQILAAQRESNADLLVLCAPYLEDYAALGRDSAGTNLDILMSRSTTPLLVTREPHERPSNLLGRILMPLTPFRQEIVHAASWALRLVSKRGGLRLIGVFDPDAINGNVDRLLTDHEEIDEQELAGLRRPEVAGLIGALQRQAAKQDLNCRVTFRSGDLVSVITGIANDEEALLVISSPVDVRASAYQSAQALVRESRNPVLLV